MKTRFLLIVMVAVPVVTITARCLYALPDCNKSMPDTATACLTGSQDCSKHVAPCASSAIGLYNISNLSTAKHYDPLQTPATTLAEQQSFPCADQYNCTSVWSITAGGYICTKGTQVLDANGSPVRTYKNAWVSVSCQIPG